MGTTEDELREILRDNGSVLVLGGASNVVLGETIDRCVCLIRNRGISAVAVGGQVEVTAAAGESWHALVRYTLGRGLFGLENLALIPGSVGAAPLQNIGAYGVELSIWVWIVILLVAAMMFLAWRYTLARKQSTDVEEEG